MPSAPLRLCETPGCSTPVLRGHCASHQKVANRAITQATDPRYGTQRWRRYSQKRLAEHPFCTICPRLADVTDHVLPVRTHPHLFWDETNHQSLCFGCNRRKEEALTVERYVVCGPVGSGKTTWVNARAKPGDVVWDLDAMGQTVAQLPTFPRPPHMVDLLMAIRQSIVQWVTRHSEVNAYFIVLKQDEAEQLAREVNAKVIALTARRPANTMAWVLTTQLAWDLSSSCVKIMTGG